MEMWEEKLYKAKFESLYLHFINLHGSYLLLFEMEKFIIYL